MPTPLNPKGYMTKKRKMDLYDQNLKYIGERMIYTYRDKYYIVKGNGKAYEIGLKQIGNHVFAMIKPNGSILS